MRTRTTSRLAWTVMALLAALALGAAACGDDDGGGGEVGEGEAGDVDAYCALVDEAEALSAVVVETQDPAELERLTAEQLALAERIRSVAPPRIRASYDVVVDVVREYQTIASSYGWDLERMVRDGVFDDLASSPAVGEANAAIEEFDASTCGTAADG